MDDLKRRLDRIESNQQEMRQTLTEISAAAKQMNGTVINILAELGEAPDYRLRGDRPTIRDRIHELQNESAAAKIAASALEAMKAAQAQTWSRREKIGLFTFATLGAASYLLRLFGVG